MSEDYEALDKANDQSRKEWAMPDSYDGNTLSVAQCKAHGVFDIREICCPQCKKLTEAI